MRVAVVSGATSGIGRAVAERLCRDGFLVTGFGLTAATAVEHELTADLDRLRIVEADVRRPDQIATVVDGAREEYGRIDVLCNAAGIKLGGDLMTSTAAAWDETFAVNVNGLVNVTRAVLPTMIGQRSGSIVNIGSPSALADPASIAYGASKAAVAALTTSLALAHLRDGIRVNLVVPGSTRTAMNANRPEALTRELARSNVAGRINQPEDVASAVSFLASDAAATISGAQIEVGAIAGVIPNALVEDSGPGVTGA